MALGWADGVPRHPMIAGPFPLGRVPLFAATCGSFPSFFRTVDPDLDRDILSSQLLTQYGFSGTYLAFIARRQD
jgi:hypothetical protein